MSERVDAGLLSSEYEPTVIRQFVKSTLSHLSDKDGLYPDGIDILSERTPALDSLHTALASFITANAVSLSLRGVPLLSPDHMVQWQENNPELTVDHIKAYACIASSFCTAAGLAEQGEAAADYIGYTAEVVMQREEGCTNIKYLWPQQVEADFEQLEYAA